MGTTPPSGDTGLFVAIATSFLAAIRGVPSNTRRQQGYKNILAETAPVPAWLSHLGSKRDVIAGIKVKSDQRHGIHQLIFQRAAGRACHGVVTRFLFHVRHLYPELLVD